MPARRPALALLALALLLATAAAAGLVLRDGPAARAARAPVPASSVLRPGVTVTPAAVPAARRAARARLARRLGDRAVLQVDRRTGGVRSLARLDGLLTGPRAGDPRGRVLDYVAAHESIFGLDARDRAALVPVARERRGGLVTVRFRQEVRGVPLHDADLRGTLTADGRIVSVGGGAVPGAAAQVASVRPRVARPRAGRGGSSELVLTSVTGPLRLAWHVVRHEGRDAVVDRLVDARTGQELTRFDRVKHLRQGRVYDGYPGAPVGGSQRTVDMTPWLTPGATELEGPHAHVGADPDGDAAIDDTERIRPDGAGDWLDRRTPHAGPMCTAVGCGWDRSQAGSWRANLRQTSTQLFALLNDFAAHTTAAPLSFAPLTGANRVVGLADHAASGPGDMPREPGDVNNASMYVPHPSKGGPVMRMFLWGGSRAPANNGSDDASVVFHEFTHAINGRAVVDARGWSRMYLRQAYAMDESLADFFALDLLVARGTIRDTTTPAEVKMAPHVDPLSLGRTMPADCPVAPHAGCVRDDATDGGYTYGDVGSVLRDGPEPHADGEVLTQALWDLRTAFIADLGAGPGLERVRELVAAAVRGLPIEPTFLDLRNAVLLADQARHGGSSADRIWRAFAARGMGWFASAADGDDITPVQDTSLPPAAATGAITGTVTDRATGATIAGATVTLGGHDTGAGTATSPATPADRVATTDAEGRFRLDRLPAGTYPRLAVEARGYETGAIAPPVVGTGTVGAPVALRRNWADTRRGASVQGFTGPDETPSECGPAQALDGDRTSGWVTDDPDADGRSITVVLPQELRITSFALDPTARAKQDCYGHWAAPPAELEIEVSGEREGVVRGWTRVLRVEGAAVPAHRLTEVRPVAPLDGVRRVRLTVRRPDGEATGVALSELMVFASPKVPARAAFTVTPETPDVAQEVTVDAAPTRAGSAPIATHAWDLDGDGTYDDAHGRTATTTFAEAGVKRIGLRVTDSEGESDEVTRRVVVGTGAEVFDLGTLEPDEAGNAKGLGINDRGVAVGQTQPGGGVAKAFRYRGGDMEQLPALPGHALAVAFNVNAAGDSAGTSQPGPGAAVKPVLWTGTEPAVLPTFGGASGQARDVSDRGVVVGTAADATGRLRPFVKAPDGALTDVEALGGVPADKREGGMAARIAANGDITGCRRFDGANCEGDAFRFDAASSTFRVLPDLGYNATGIDVDASGTVGGWTVGTDGRAKPARWVGDALQKLRTLGGPSGAVVALDEAGVGYGTADAADGRGRAARWPQGTTLPQDLNDLVRGSGWELEDVQTVNGRREAIGFGWVGTRRRAFQLNLGPCRVCLSDVRVEEVGQPSGEWQPAGVDGTVDGNAVRASVLVRNEDDQTHVVQVKGRDETAGRALEPAGAVALDPGEEERVTLDLDTEGLAWDAQGRPHDDHVLRLRATLGHTVFSSRAAVLKVRPKPVVLVHGMLADAQTWAPWQGFVERAHPDWQAFAVGDGQGGGVRMDTGSWGDLAATPKTVAENARVLDRYLAGVRDTTDAARVDLVGHSMGGLISRRWIHHLMPDPAGAPPQVAHLVQLGTPNMGSPCAELFDFDEWLELRRDVASGFNAEITDRKGVPFSVLAGTPLPATCLDGETGDGVVALSSAEWRIADRERAPMLHTDMTGSGAAFATFVLPRLNGTRAVPAEPAGLGARAAAAEDDEPVRRSHQLLGEQRLTVAPGPAATARFAVDGGSALHVDVLARPEVTAELVGPDGTVADRIAAGERAGRGLVRALSADGPAAGEWTVRLSTAGAAAQAAVVARLAEDPWLLDLRVGAAAAGGATPVVAAVVNGARRVRGATVSVAVRRRGEAERSFTLHDDGAHGDGLTGDGCYGAAGDLPTGEGVMTLRVSGGGKERMRRTLVDVAAPAGDGRAAMCPRPAGRNGEIAFGQRQGTGRLPWTTTPAGADLAPIPDDVEDVTWSPEGDRVAWTQGVDRVVVADVAGDAPRTLIGGDGIDRTEADWSPDGSRLAYARTCRGGPTVGRADACVLAVLDIASGTETVVGGERPVHGDAPTWSPDGERLAYVAADRTCPVDCSVATELRTVRLDGTGDRRVTERLVGVGEPDWSPTQDRIAFSHFSRWDRESPAAPDREIAVVDADGSGLRTLTDDGECDPVEGGACRVDDEDLTPAWSPDGRRIAFASTRDEPPAGDDPPRTNQLWTMRADGQGARAVTATPTKKRSPAWRPLPFLLDGAPPSCDDVAASVAPGQTVRIALACADPNGDPLTVRVLRAPASGSLAAPAADASVRFTAPAAEGDVTFTYTASDGTADAPAATVTVTVKAPPPPPPPPPDDERPDDRPDDRPDERPEPRPEPRPQPRPNPTPWPGGGCAYNPVTGGCGVPATCGPGNPLDNCTGRFAEAPRRSGPRAAAAAAAARTTARALLRPATVRIAPGQTRTVTLKLTAHGRRTLKARKVLRLRVAYEARVAGKGVVYRTTRTLVVRMPARRPRG